jgi:NAD(P)-dependent dehydrogenase (short-subunit alcohol dehydrogenase family)
MKIVICTRKDPTQVRVALNRLCPGSLISDDKIRIQPMDLSDLTTVEVAVQQIASIEKKVDVLLNCAGISSLPSRQLTAQNFEMQLGL